MAAEFKLPDLGENIEKGEVISVLVAVGDQLAEDQPVVELETDKAVIEVPSSVSGTIVAIHVSQGDTINVGQAILEIDGGTAPAVAAPATAAAPEAQPAAVLPDATPPPQPIAAVTTRSQDVTLPELGEGVDSGDVVGIMVSIGDQVEEEQGLLEIEIDKGVVELPAPAAGKVTALHLKEGDRATVGQLIATLEVSVGGSAAVATPAAATSSAPASQATSSHATSAQTAVSAPASTMAAADLPARKLVPAAPSVRRLAREIGVDVGAVKGNGPGGRISEADVKSHSKQLHETRSAGGTGVAAIALPDFSKWGEIDAEPFSNVRRITAQRMVQSWTSIPHVTQFDQADVTDLEVFRKSHGKAVEKAGGKLTPTALILKVVAAALVKFPQFCASIDMAGEQIIYKKYRHIGIAVDTKRGLLVPVLRDVDQKTVTELSIELGEMAEKTRTGRVGIDEMQGGCFTISNLGGIGGTAFTPIINAPEVAILGVARSKTEAVHIDGQFQPRMIMPLSLSYDHRVIDGADGARFLRYICECLENPFYLAFEG
ncbi:MAG: dihydrolipoyllysine-residue acetyltransferase [Gemmatimonadetes bacterium]|nr:dihydrolipoyllysine-residue acetyltransferase [Gemmatimonadota bacterium]MBT5060779.1 dihydrolipoyllysine-residue acetyltransferase [Gemmatimonadota bacterium]MBT5146843.1 dihydrolipoyllysine-residue acetyltransferase [Gemmatimonadota bacterium]MBT5590132.1 dihydrolipoyllysine-residue acetyltransferase [Gemmatimonadota bacterium]MBT5961673.1 dihydrolipoyllysine-residue acetyltransferase [Gemmatimonadota bacterium]